MLFDGSAQLEQFGVIIAKNPARLAWVGHNALNGHLQYTVLIESRSLLHRLRIFCAGDQGIKASPQPKLLFNHGPSPPLPGNGRQGHPGSWDHSQGWIAQSWEPHSNGRYG